MSELDDAVEAAWVMGGCRISQRFLSRLVDTPRGGSVVLEGLTVERAGTRPPKERGRGIPEFRVLGLAVGWETLAEVGERVAKARLRRELSA